MDQPTPVHCSKINNILEHLFNTTRVQCKYTCTYTSRVHACIFGTTAHTVLSMYVSMDVPTPTLWTARPGETTKQGDIVCCMHLHVQYASRGRHGQLHHSIVFFGGLFSFEFFVVGGVYWFCFRRSHNALSCGHRKNLAVKITLFDRHDEPVRQ